VSGDGVLAEKLPVVCARRRPGAVQQGEGEGGAAGLPGGLLRVRDQGAVAEGQGAVRQPAAAAAAPAVHVAAVHRGPAAGHALRQDRVRQAARGALARHGSVSKFNSKWVPWQTVQMLFQLRPPFWPTDSTR